MTGLRWLPRPGAICWAFESAGTSYCAITPNGTDRIDLWFRTMHGQWLFSHSRPLGEKSAHDVAEEIRQEVTQ